VRKLRGGEDCGGSRRADGGRRRNSPALASSLLHLRHPTQRGKNSSTCPVWSLRRTLGICHDEEKKPTTPIKTTKNPLESYDHLQSNHPTMNALVAFFLGQLSIALLIFAFIKFFIFGDAPPSTPADRRKSRPLLHSGLRHKKSAAVLRPAPVLSTSTILKKTYYNVSGHQPESLDWFNVLVAQTLAQLRAEAQHEGNIVKILNGLLNGPWKPDFLDDIVITEVNLGEEFPIFSNCRIIPVDEGPGRPGTADGSSTAAGVEGTRLQARLDVDLNDVITLGIETKLVLNYPKPVSAILPVALAVSVVRFRGTVSVFSHLVPHVS
jgi:Maintenance of mitochondrial morphology protein 1